MTKPMATIVQEYVPAYRAPLFEAMRDLAQSRDFELCIAAGEAGPQQHQRDDAARQFVPDRHVRQRELKIAGRRVVTRSLDEVYARSDLVVLEQARRNLDAYRALATRRATIGLWGHGADTTQQVGSLEARLLRTMTSRADWFFAYTDAGADAAVTAGLSRDRITVLRNSTDTATLRSHLDAITTDERTSFKRDHDLTNRTVVFVGGLDDSKLLPLLVEASTITAQRIPGFRLLIVGSGPASATLPDASWLKRIPHATGGSLALALSAGEALVMPGRVGLVAVDALTAGLPVLTTDYPWHGPERDYLDESTSVVTAQRPAAFAHAMISILQDADRRSRIRSAALAASAGLSVEAMAQRFVDGIGKALDA
ncbi:glycosyltransferase family 4 protein [Demequina sediminicola]|uniref:glycosyltransferase family 4 protein n=1 Tax=Demequina sediminicola TaxID=1095026 RepID=UPI0007846AC1|nr:glycosyltransferase family 4 protein [Demequina sediminicola]